MSAMHFDAETGIRTDEAMADDSIRYSRGRSKFDASPEQRVASDFDAFEAAFLADRSARKGQTFICAAFRINGDGRPHRGKDEALPRAFLPFDLDSIPDAETFNDLRQWFTGYRGFGYTTASHRPDAPRCRIVLAADRAITRDEGKRACLAMQRRIERDFGLGVLKFDEAVYRAEQPLFTPLHGAMDFRFLGEPVNVDELLAEVPPEAESGPARRNEPGAHTDWLAALLEGDDVHGNACRLIGRWVALGWDDATIRATMDALAIGVAAARGRERAAELLGEELDRMIEGARRNGYDRARDGAGGAQDGEPEPADDWPGDGAVGEYLRTPAPPVAWYAHERLLAGRGHLLTGIGGSSKTRMLYHLGIGAVLGRLPWDWQIDGTGSAALFLCEDTAANVHRTLAAMRSAMQLSADEIALLAERLCVFGLAGKPSHLLMAAPGGVLTESFRVEALLAKVRSLPQPVAFIGLDPALGLTEGDEMNSAHQRRLGELVDRVAIETGACAMLATHSAKSLQSADEIGSHSSRGSGAITDAVRGEFALRTMTAAEARQFGISDLAERKAYVQLVGVKGNELPPSAFVPVWLRRGSGGVLYPVALEPQAAAAIGKRETAALDELRKLAATSAPTLKVWRDACTDAGLLTGPTERAREKAMERIRDALLAAGLIERGIGRGVFVPAQAEGPA